MTPLLIGVFVLFACLGLYWGRRWFLRTNPLTGRRVWLSGIIAWGMLGWAHSAARDLRWIRWPWTGWTYSASVLVGVAGWLLVMSWEGQQERPFR